MRERSKGHRFESGCSLIRIGSLPYSPPVPEELIGTYALLSLLQPLFEPHLVLAGPQLPAKTTERISCDAHELILRMRLGNRPEPRYDHGLISERSAQVGRREHNRSPKNPAGSPKTLVLIQERDR